MRICVIAFRQTASDITPSADKIVRLLNDSGLMVSEILYLSDAVALSKLKDSLLQLFDAIFIIGGDVDTRAALGGVVGAFTVLGKASVYILPENLDAAQELIKHSAAEHILVRTGESFGKITLKAFCITDSDVMRAVQKARDAAKDRLKIYVSKHCHDYTIEIVYNHLTPKFATDEAVRLINTQLFNEVYSQDGESLEKTAFDLLMLRGLTLSVAESFTAGQVAQRLLYHSGASKIFFEGITAYSNNSKIERLGVLQSTLNEFGAVSDQTAYEMAAGLLNTGNCGAAVSTTGIAGPQSEGTSKPVGLCFIAVGTGQEVNVYRYLFSGDREQITRKGANAAFFGLIKALKKV